MSWDSLPIFRDNDLYVDFNMGVDLILSFQGGACARLSIGCARRSVSYTRDISV